MYKLVETKIRVEIWSLKELSVTLGAPSRTPYQRKDERNHPTVVERKNVLDVFLGWSRMSILFSRLDLMIESFISHPWSTVTVSKKSSDRCREEKCTWCFSWPKQNDYLVLKVRFDDWKLSKAFTLVSRASLYMRAQIWNRVLPDQAYLNYDEIAV